MEGTGMICPRCGTPLPDAEGRRRGRPRVWCSDACRRSAYAERVAAEHAGLAVRVVTAGGSTPPAPDSSPGELARRVLADPSALRILLASLAESSHSTARERLAHRQRAEHRTQPPGPQQPVQRSDRRQHRR